MRWFKLLMQLWKYSTLAYWSRSPKTRTEANERYCQLMSMVDRGRPFERWVPEEEEEIKDGSITIIREPRT